MVVSLLLASLKIWWKSYDGNRRILNTNFPTLFSVGFNPGTSGSVSDFLDSVFYPNTPPNVSSSQFTINEFEVSGSSVGTITTTDAEHFSYELSFEPKVDIQMISLQFIVEVVYYIKYNVKCKF